MLFLLAYSIFLRIDINRELNRKSFIQKASNTSFKICYDTGKDCYQQTLEMQSYLRSAAQWHRRRRLVQLHHFQLVMTELRVHQLAPHSHEDLQMARR